MKVIYFVRHCQYDNPRNIYPGRLPVPLSAAGMEEAERLRTYFADKHIDKIFSSAVLRCKLTAEVIADKKIPIEFDQRLLEVFSAYQGYWAKELHMAEGWHEYYTHRPELGGEGHAEVQKRVVAFFNDLITRQEDRVIVCSHGDPLHFIYLHLKNTPLPRSIIEFDNPEYLRKGWIRPLFIDNGEIHFEPMITQEELATIQ